MQPTSLEADYLVIGCGVMGMGFTDALVTESNASVIMVDRHARPGGHWNDAYSFVRLHQPSGFYGVNSLQLGRDSIDQSGPNRGFYELASGPEILAYYDQVMQKLVASGRVRWFPSSNYRGEGRFVSHHSGAEYHVTVRKAIVDATYTNTQVPLRRKPDFAIAEGVRCVPIHELSQLDASPSAYVIIGAGKTAIDACLFLLDRGVEPDRIRWVRPRDAWLVNRAHVQPGQLAFGTVEGLALQVEAAASAESIADLFARLSAARHLLRIDEEVTPTMYRCATVTEPEIAQLRRIERVIRLGRVQRIESDRIVLERGSVPSDPGCLYVDCTAPGISRRKKRPVFGDKQITLQPVRACQPSFSAALIGHVEASYEDATAKNALCAAVPYPEASIDWLKVMVAGSLNEQAWRKDKALRGWIEQSRLHGKQGANRAASESDPTTIQNLQRVRDGMPKALANLSRLLEQAGAALP